jgi:hypothetical protein
MRLTAHCDLYRRIPRLMGPQLYKMRKVPYVLPEDTPLAARVEETLRTVKLYVTRRYRPDVAGALPLSLRPHAAYLLTPFSWRDRLPYTTRAVGNVSMSAQELIDNVMACVQAMLAALPSHDLIKAVQLHATRGPAFTITPHPTKGGPSHRAELQ